MTLRAERGVTQRRREESSFGVLDHVDYKKLREIAARLLRRHTLKERPRPTSLLHRALVRIADREDALEIEDHDHALAIMARAMRFVLVDRCRDAAAEKRGGGRLSVPLEDVTLEMTVPAEELLGIHELLEALAERDPRKAQVVELRFFGGLELKEIAQVTRTSLATVKRDWNFARAFFLHKLER